MEDKKSNLQGFWERIKQETLAGLRHGFFDYSVTSELKDGKRHVIMKSGKHYKFTIPQEEIRDDSSF